MRFLGLSNHLQLVLWPYLAKSSGGTFRTLQVLLHDLYTCTPSTGPSLGQRKPAAPRASLRTSKPLHPRSVQRLSLAVRIGDPICFEQIGTSGSCRGSCKPRAPQTPNSHHPGMPLIHVGRKILCGDYTVILLGSL